MQRLAVAHRPYVSWPQALAMEGVFDGVQESELAVVAELFACSYVVLPSMLPLWHCALESLHRRRFDRFLVLMLPALEHAVRRVFACVNGCPERSITAESGALYTTFDEMLSPVLPDGAGNCLEEELPCFLVTPPELLRDLLERPEGPRLRDRLSHGQADFEDIPQTLANHVLCVAVVLAAHYALDRHVLERSPVSVCVAVSRRYVSLFHPVSLLKGELLQLLSLAEVLPAGEPPVSLAATTAHLLALLLPSHTAELVLTPGLLVELVGSVWQQLLRPPPSSCYSQQLELAALLRRAVGWAAKSTAQIRETLILRRGQLQQRELRSRQRANYQLLLESVGLYKHTVYLLVALVVIATQHIKSSSSKTMIKRTKKVLQFTENFYSQTLPIKNCWQEANKLCYALAETLSLFECQ